MDTLSRGHTAEVLDSALKSMYLKDFTGSINSFIKVYPGGWLLPSGYTTYERSYFDYKFRPDDVLVMSYPKSGSTWMQEIVWTMRNNPNLNNPDAAETLYTRSPFIGRDMFVNNTGPLDDATIASLKTNILFEGFFKHCPDKDLNYGLTLQLTKVMPSPRTLKMHLPISLMDRNLLETCKVVYMTRNPKDVVLSFMHHCRLLKLHSFVGSQDAFVDYFVEDMMLFGPYAEHLKEAWQLRYHPNLLWVFYEDLKKDTLGQLRRVDAFMGTELTEAQLLNVQEHTSFSNMKANDPNILGTSVNVNNHVQEKDGEFFRTGQVGSWKGKYTAEQERKIDDWIKKNFESHGIQFTYE